VTFTGLAPVLLVCGAAYFLTTSLAGLRPEWRDMDRGRQPGSAERPGADAERSGADAGPVLPKDLV
jgi:hypothetical protein